MFDGSRKTSTGKSLNSILGDGPKLQRDIFEILLNFQFPERIFSTDIEKIYHQILVTIGQKLPTNSLVVYSK